MQRLTPELTTWHITFDTYGRCLHGGERPTVDKGHNQPGQAFLSVDPVRVQTARRLMRFTPVRFSLEQRRLIQEALPEISVRGGWGLRACAAGDDHVHVLLDIAPQVHGEKVRRVIKRWLGEALSERWPLPQGATWWAEEGSNKPVKDADYLRNVYEYVVRQRA